jgi:putative chitinase
MNYGIRKMTYDQLDALGIDHKWLGPLEETFAKYDISTPARQASFIGQCSHESANFHTLEENLHYSAASLMRVWPSRFPNLDVANQFANNPEKIANKVYAGRMGNGNEETGDGWNYHGRGLIQLTGKDNYTNCGSNLGVDLIGNPSSLVDPKYATLSAGWFWSKHGLNALADSSDYETMTKRINGGLLGLDDRKAKIAKALSVLG